MRAVFSQPISELDCFDRLHVCFHQPGQLTCLDWRQVAACHCWQLAGDEDCILDLGGYVEVRTNRFCDESFDLVSGDPPHLGQQAGGAGFLGADEART